MTTQPIYLDFNASTPIAPEVAEAMTPSTEGADRSGEKDRKGQCA